MWDVKKVVKAVRVASLIPVIFLSSCSVLPSGTQYTREEISQAFKERDAYLGGLATAIKQIQDKVGIKNEVKK